MTLKHIAVRNLMRRKGKELVRKRDRAESIA